MKFMNQFMSRFLSPAEPEYSRERLFVPGSCPEMNSRSGSFEDYVKEKYHGTYLREIQAMAGFGVLPVGKSGREVCEPDVVMIGGIDIVRILFGIEDYVYDTSEDLPDGCLPGYPFTVQMRAVIKASITLSEDWGCSRYSDTLEQWYQANGHVVFYPDWQEFHPVDSVCIYDKDQAAFANPLTAELSPHLKKKDLDAVASRILDAFYREALKAPTPMKAKKLAGRLGLNVMDAALSNDGSLFGMLVMRNSRLMIGGQPAFAPAGTILIDREACLQSRGGRVGWVILHECIHYILHRPFYEARKFLQPEIACFCCGAFGGKDESGELGWLEWQADSLPARLLIPEQAARGFIESRLDVLRRSCPRANEETILRKLTAETASRFNTSWMCSAIRLVELGYAADVPALPRSSDCRKNRAGCADGNQTHVRHQESGLEEERRMRDILSRHQTLLRALSSPSEPVKMRAAGNYYDHYLDIDCMDEHPDGIEEWFWYDDCNDENRDALFPTEDVPGENCGFRSQNRSFARHRGDSYPSRMIPAVPPSGHTTSGSMKTVPVDAPVPPDKTPGSRTGTPHTGPRYAVSLHELLDRKDPDHRLMKELVSGRYVSADSRFCLNDPKYVWLDYNGVPHLTDHAVLHEDECCLPFWERKRHGRYADGLFHMDAGSGREIVCGHGVGTDWKAAKRVYSSMSSVIEDLPASVGGTLKAHMRRLHVSVEDLEERSQVSGTTIKDIRGNRCGTLELSYFIAICIGLGLEPAYSLDLIRKTRYRFNSDKESTMYVILLTTMYTAGIDACNKVLTENKLRPLTRKFRYENCWN